MFGKRCVGFAVVVLGVVVLAWAAIDPVKLTINGTSVTTDVIERNGRAYVPLADVAKALGCSVTKSGGGYVLGPSGGANQVDGLNAKIGQTVRTPYFTFVVQKVVQEDHHQKLFGTGTVDAPDGQTLVIVVCRLKNATQKVLSFNPFGHDQTVLTDQEAHTLSTQFTGMGADVPPSRDVLPGATFDFALTFSVPKNTQLKGSRLPVRRECAVRP